VVLRQENEKQHWFAEGSARLTVPSLGCELASVPVVLFTLPLSEGRLDGRSLSESESELYGATLIFKPRDATVA